MRLICRVILPALIHELYCPNVCSGELTVFQHVSWLDLPLARRLTTHTRKPSSISRHGPPWISWIFNPAARAMAVAFSAPG